MAEFDFNGVRVPMLDSADFSFDEWEQIKAESGQTPVAFEQALRQLDPASWRAYLTRCMNRVGVSPKMISHLNLLDVANTWIERMQAEADAAAAEANPTSAADGSSQPAPSPATPAISSADSGTSISPLRSASGPGT